MFGGKGDGERSGEENGGVEMVSVMVAKRIGEGEDVEKGVVRDTALHNLRGCTEPFGGQGRLEVVNMCCNLISLRARTMLARRQHCHSHWH